MAYHHVKFCLESYQIARISIGTCRCACVDSVVVHQICICEILHTCTYAYICLCMHVYLCNYVCICMYICVQMCVHTDTFAYPCIHQTRPVCEAGEEGRHTFSHLRVHTAIQRRLNTTASRHRKDHCKRKVTGNVA